MKLSLSVRILLIILMLALLVAYLLKDDNVAIALLFAVGILGFGEQFYLSSHRHHQ
ncbi:hypothetical protein ACFQ22_10400 [Lentilactobacillus raoultii]|uniref:Uncharacterized protein n=1 Tax=Lentilactobacillus raoultii TaxID=1987503 RepID=A0ABW3PKX4_9LACO|nr:hypothetical protein [Lentilactobacillus raoultii]